MQDSISEHSEKGLYRFSLWILKILKKQQISYLANFHMFYKLFEEHFCKIFVRNFVMMKFFVVNVFSFFGIDCFLESPSINFFV